MSKNYYAVRTGRCPGVYRSWNECKAQVHGFPGAVFKGFDTLEEAKNFIQDNCQVTEVRTYNMPLTAYTDGSFDNGLCGWGYTLLRHDKSVVLQACGPCTKNTGIRNIGGEIQAAEEAIRKAVELHADCITICHDYEGIGRWGNGEWATTKSETRDYAQFVKAMRDRIQIYFHKVKGHSGDEYNDIADALADNGRKSQYVKYYDQDGDELNNEEVEFLIEEQGFFAESNAKCGNGLSCKL